MKRYGSSNNLVDNFSYTYYSGTNRLKNIGSGNDYTYDANGNVITDDLNKNTDFKYDWRNLMTENKNVLSLNTFWTLYKYDEAGNRINKKQYMYVLGPPPGGIETGIGGGGDSIIVDEGDGSGYWALAVNIFYVRDASGKEIAIYQGANIDQWNIYGLDNVGKIDANNKRYFYLKDHLGSIRAVLDTTNTVVSANDYDCWGYLMENRTYENTVMRYKFTGKERDKDLENNYDYFGARYYDSRIGRWGGVEPLLEKYISFTPYCYSLCNPIKLVDLNGKIVVLSSEEELTYFNTVANIVASNDILNDNKGLLTLARNNSVRDLIITNYSGGDFIGVTGQIRYNLSGETFKTDAIGIGLSSDFFDIENNYIAALILEHELIHLDYYTNTLNKKTGSEVTEWQENNELKFYDHELNAISHSLEKLEALYKDKSTKITKKEYKEAKKQFKEYEKTINKKINDFKN